jgi:hypothetical protein
MTGKRSLQMDDGGLSALTTSTRGIALKIFGASFRRDGEELVAPFDLLLARTERRTLFQPTALAASIAARIAAAIVKPTAGVVYVGDFDARLQPAQAKRLVGFVPAGGFSDDAHAFACEVKLRADVWGIPRTQARLRANVTLAALAEPRDPYARAVALALVPQIALLVLDRPRADLRERIAALVPAAAVLATEVGSPAHLALEPPEFAGTRSR